MNLVPLHDNVLVRRNDVDETSAGGIVLPGVAQEKPRLGTVVAVGKGKLVKGVLEPLKVSAGDTVLFGKTSGYEIKVGEEKLLMMPENEIYGTVK